MMKNMTLPWCNGKREFGIPENSLIWLATPRYIPGVANEAEEIRQAIRNPIGIESLAQLLGDPVGKTVAIVVDDNTRVTPINRILPVVVSELNLIGIRDEQITIIMALGSHRFMTEEEICEKIGSNCYNRLRVINHAYDDPDQQAVCGTTAAGTPVIINKIFYESDFGMCIGNIIPQFIAGWSGGAKIIQPGISGMDTTARVHLNGSLTWPQRLGNPENDIRLDMEDIARQAGLKFIINTILNLDNEIVHVVAGDVVKAHRKGVEYAREIYQLTIPQQADIVIAGSYPANKDLWQADKALAAASLMVRPGGTVIWGAPCIEGVSPEHPILLELGDLPPRRVYEMCENGDIEDVVGATAHIMIGVMREMANVILVSDGVSREEAHLMGFHYADSLDEAVCMALEAEGKNASIGVLTHGADFAPVVTSS
ncbi:MAG: nickel-dependent lactate racemase [Clostridiaceae bacterium]|nr:nickel-dependent lactate racemase [Clostridiaceae bacterium]